MPKKCIVRLTDAEREMLTGLLKRQRVAAQTVRRARVLLKADVQGPNGTDAKIAEAFDCPTRSVEGLRERLVTEGFEAALHGRPKEPRPQQGPRRRAGSQDHCLAPGTATEGVGQLDAASARRACRGAGDC
jgi:hypothetical protein